MKTLKLALASFFVGAVLSIAPIVAYAQCDSEIWFQDTSDCHVYHRYTLTGSSCNSEVCVCSYARDESACPHIEEGPCS